MKSCMKKTGCWQWSATPRVHSGYRPSWRAIYIPIDVGFQCGFGCVGLVGLRGRQKVLSAKNSSLAASRKSDSDREPQINTGCSTHQKIELDSTVRSV